MKNMGERQRRVAHLVQQVVAESINSGKIRAPQMVGGLVCVSDVWVSADLRVGRVFVSVHGAEKELVITALNEEAHLVHKILNREMNMKYIPKIKFFHDDEYDHQVKLEKALDTLREKENGAA